MVEGIGYTDNTTSVYGQDKSVLGKDDFMKLMIEQLKNQDPLNPTESQEFAAQLAQFSSLEQLSNLNSYMKESIDANYLLTQSINNTLTANLIGKDVKFEGNKLTNTGKNIANFGYTLPANAEEVTVNIYNSAGQLVKTMENQPSTQGDHKLSWDFTDNNGEKLPDGDYKVEVVAETEDETTMSASIFQYGSISGIRFTEDGTKILIDGIEYLLSDILEIISPTNSIDTLTKGGLKDVGN